MPLPIEDLTPREIVRELDRYIVGQNAAKRAVAVALRNRYRRQQLPEAQRDEITPKNILMIGPTGVGKTEIARRLAQLARAPFIKVEATKFTEVGYVGRDVESMIRELAAASVRLVEKELTEEVRPEAERRTLERLIDLVDSELATTRPRATQPNPMFSGFMTVDAEADEIVPTEEYDYEAEEKKTRARRKRIEKKILSGEYDDTRLEIDSEESNNPFVQVFTPGGMEEMGIDSNQLGGAFGSRRVRRTVSLREAREILFQEEAKQIADKATIQREAILRAEQTGIIFLDEIDKVAGKSGGSGPDVSREGVQRDLLPIIEGSTVQTKYGPLRTDHILFIAAGAFHMAKPSDLIPELQGRLPIRVELDPLSETDLRRILQEPKNALTLQYRQLLEADGISIEFTSDALDEIAHVATQVNRQTENIGARRLHTIMERLLEEVLFEAPELETKQITFTGEHVKLKLGAITANLEKSRNVL